MKINLWTSEGWKLFDSDTCDMKKELADRKIIIGNYAKIGDSAKIGHYAKIGNSAKIGYSATIGDSAKIGYHATITKKDMGDVFSENYIFCQLGIVMQNGTGVFYKAVKKDFTSFYEKCGYSYNKKPKRINAERNQKIECGVGYHFTNYWNAVSFGAQSGAEYIIISAEIALKDILSVHQKIRTCYYKNVKKVNLFGR